MPIVAHICAALAALSVLTPPPAAGAGYVLTLETSAADVRRITLNGTVLVRDRPLSEVRFQGEKIPSMSVPLRDAVRGPNVLELEYRAGPPGIAAIVVRRDGTARTAVVAAQLAPTVGRGYAVERIRFDAPDAPATRAQLATADRDAILGVLRRYHAALAARDRVAVVAEYGPWAPDRVRALERNLAGLLGAPSFAMQPLDVGGLEWLVSEAVVELRRADGAPVVRSTEVAAPAPSAGGGGAVQIAPPRLYFKRDGARWKLTLRP